MQHSWSSTLKSPKFAWRSQEQEIHKSTKSKFYSLVLCVALSMPVRVAATLGFMLYTLYKVGS